jgi:hypothetical protein
MSKQSDQTTSINKASTHSGPTDRDLYPRSLSTIRRFFKSLYLFVLFTIILVFVVDTFTIQQFRNDVMQTVNPSDSQYVMKELYRLAEVFDKKNQPSFYNCMDETLSPWRDPVSLQKEDPGRFIALNEAHRCGFKRLGQLKAFDLINLSPYDIAAMPGDYLTLILTLAMGALGSLLYITKRFVEEVLGRYKLNADTRLEPISWFLFRPILGMITALVMFIFVKAGQLSIANPGASGSGQAELNPYLVSFVAIASGYLCWQAIERIQKAGERFFQGSIENPRWAYGLQQAIEAHGRSLTKKHGEAEAKTDTENALARGITSVAQQVKVSEEQLKRWGNQKDQVPQNMQSQLTQLLSINPPLLFTDIPPDQQS